MLPAFFLFLCLEFAGAQQPSDGAFKVCSYNLRNWLTMERGVGAKAKSSSKPEREKAKVVQFVAEIAPAVLGVCEIGTQQDLQELRDLLAKAGLAYPHMVFSHGTDPVRSLGLLSQFPVVANNSQTHLNYRLGEETFLVQRGFLDVVVDAGQDFRLRLVGVHLKSKREVAEADQAMMRRNEAHLLRAHLDGVLTANPEERVLLYGDFNEDPREAAIEEVAGSSAVSNLYMRSVLLRDANGEVWTHNWQLHDLYSRLDYFFMSRTLRPYINTKAAFIYTAKDFMAASDHRPIVVTIDPLLPKSKRRR